MKINGISEKDISALIRFQDQTFQCPHLAKYVEESKNNSTSSTDKNLLFDHLQQQSKKLGC